MVGQMNIEYGKFEKRARKISDQNDRLSDDLHEIQ